MLFTTDTLYILTTAKKGATPSHHENTNPHNLYIFLTPL